MKKLLLLGLLGSLACGTDVPTQPAMDDLEPQFAKVQNRWVDYTGQSWWNQCTNEYMITSGRYHVVSTRTDDGSGGWHYISHLNLNMRAVGETSGDVYKWQYSQNYRWNVNGNNPQETYVYALDYVFRSKTGMLMVYTSKNRFTVNANGDVTVTVSDFGVTCR